MKKSDMVEIMLEFERSAQEYHCGVKFMENLLKKMVEAGMEPPCVDGDKCQALMKKYIDPSFNYWDEDYDKMMEKE